jgi:thiosulfate reductase/polysulfide reductase chain A
MKRTEVKIIKTCCQASHSECGVLVHVKDGKVIKIEGDPDHPFNKGKLCIKGVAYKETLYHPDRNLYPKKRIGEPGEGKWVRISWDEALDIIASRFRTIKQEYGPLSICTELGTQPRGNFSSTTRLAYALGSPNAGCNAHICFAPSVIAEWATYGSFVTAEVGPDYSNANCVLIWGANPLVSHPPRGRDILEAKNKGAKLIVVDPRYTKLASKADLWLQIRPGTDNALALSMMNIIINEKLYDDRFVHNWCVGFEKLAQRVQDYPPERVSEVTWIPEEQIRKAARMYATIRPAALHHRVALEMNINSFQSCRSAAILIALTGNFDVKGGNVVPCYPPGFLTRPYLIREAGEALGRELGEKRLGADELPLFSGPDSPFQSVYVPTMIKAMLTGKPYPVKALFTVVNPLLSCENTKLVYSALRSLEFLVVVDFFMTPTAELADIVLPPATWLEKDGVCVNSYQNFITVRQKAIEPLGECWDDKKIAIEIAKRMGGEEVKKFFPWDNPVEYLNYRMKGMNITFEDLKERVYIIESIRYEKYKEEGFRTSSGKVELCSSIAEKYGYDGLPSYEEPPESPISTPGLAEEYPLILTTGGKDIVYFHSEGRQIPSLRKITPNPLLDIHRETAERLGIEDGSWVWIETPRGRVKQKAHVTLGIYPRVVHARHGWWFPEKLAPEHGLWDSNINIVTTGDPHDPIVGSTALRGTLCKVYPV